jgi:PKD repeat protein
MRKFAVILLLSVLVALVTVGCKQDKLSPYFTRLQTSEDCGVVPFTVQFVARVSGGNGTTDPTGANAYLDIDWNFGDGATATGSLVYHTYEQPGDYQVQVSVKDKDGDGESQSLPIEVHADSLTIRAVPLHKGAGEPDTSVTVGQVLTFNVFATTCGFDKDTGNYDTRFLFNWAVGDTAHHVYTGRSPSCTYRTPGLKTVTLRVTDDQAFVVRTDTLTVQVDAP